MAHLHRMANKYSPTIFIITIILGLVSAQNITEPQNTTLTITENPAPSSATPKTLLALDISTILPSTKNETSAIPAENSTILPEPRLLQDIPTSSEKPPDSSTSSIKPKASIMRKIPPDCSHRRKNRKQPENSAASRLHKCCPNGETLVSEENGDQTVENCKPQQIGEFTPEVLSVELYTNCIEDLEIPVKLEIEVGNPCADGVMYSPSTGDHLTVIQDGSLLIMDTYFNESYTVQTNYCLDTNIETGELYAIVCVSETDEHLTRGQTIFYTCFMIVSIPCLCVVSFLHFAIKELRSVHGLSLGVMSSCMAIGFTLHTFAQFSDTGKSWIGFAVQFFMLAYFFWLFCLCCNVVAHVCYYLPNKVIINRTIRYCHFNTYCIISFSFPFALVLWTNYKGLPGMPSYFYQGLTESVVESQRYFIPPVTVVLILCFLLLIVSFFGYKYLDKINFRYATYQQVTVYSQTTLPIHIYDQESYQEIRKDTKCICCLYVVTIISWILEVVTFYSPGQDGYNAFMEVINALQGAFVLMIFIVVRRRRNAIVRWWHGRGPHGLTAVPMKDLIPVENRLPPEPANSS